MPSIFSRKRPEDDLSVGIELNQDIQRPFHAGNLVSGRVVLTSPIPLNVENININFFGRTKTHITRTRHRGTGNNRRTQKIHYDDDANLFHFPVILAHHVSVHDQLSQWNFQFTFPSETPNSRNEFTDKAGVWKDTPHSLPPTFHDQRGAYDECSISYGLEVFVNFPASDRPIIRALPLPFMPTSMPLNHPPLLEKIRARDFSSRTLVGQKPTFFQSVGDKFSDKTPRIDFTMKTAIPSQVIISSTPFPIFTAISIDRLSSSDISISSLQVQFTKLKISSFSLFRAKRQTHDLWTGFDGFDEESETWENSAIYLNAQPPTATIQECRDSGDESKQRLNFPHTFHARIPEACCPTFQTFNIAHGHIMKFTMEVKICDKTFELSDEIHVQLLSPQSPQALSPTAVNQSQASQATGNFQVSPQYRGSTPPPTYPGNGEGSSGQSAVQPTPEIDTKESYQNISPSLR